MGIVARSVDVLPKTRVRVHRGKSYTVSEAHPAADLLRWMTDDELDALAADITINTQRQAVLRLRSPDLRLIDGRNRELACMIAGVPVWYQDVSLTDLEICDRIKSLNFNRRHDNETQRALAAAKLVNARRGSNQHARQREDDPDANRLLTQNWAAQWAGVTRKAVKRARKLLCHGTPELVEAVESGRLDLTPASKLTAVPRDWQIAIAASKDPKRRARYVLAALEDGPVSGPVIEPPQLLVSDPADLSVDGPGCFRIPADAPTLGDNEYLPGLPRLLLDGRVWCGLYFDNTQGMFLAYLIPTECKAESACHLLVYPAGSELLYPTRDVLKLWAVRHLLDSTGFDLFAAGWHPTTRFRPGPINPWFVRRYVEDQQGGSEDPLSDDDREFVRRGLQRLERKAVRP